MTLKEYCQLYGGSELFFLLSENINPAILRHLESNHSDLKTILDIDKIFSSIAYDVIYNFMKFSINTRINAENVKTF